MKNKILKFLGDIVLIVFSILLALIANEYRNNLKKKEDLEVAISKVTDELNLNKEIIENVIPYHDSVLFRLENAIKNPDQLDKLKTDYGLDFFKVAPMGIFQRVLSNTAWETTKISGVVSELENNKLQRLTRTYDQQELTFLPALDAIDIISSREFLDNEKARENVLMLYWQINELKGREATLLDYYNDTLEALMKSSDSTSAD